MANRHWIDWMVPQHCSECDVRMRPRSTTTATTAPPTAARLGARGLCESCYGRAARRGFPAGTPESYFQFPIPPCVGCGVKLVGQRAEDPLPPGTARLHGLGLCLRCYHAARKAGTLGIYAAARARTVTPATWTGITLRKDR